MLGLARRLWSLDRRIPHEIWTCTLLLGLVTRGVFWLVHLAVPTALGLPFSIVAGTSLAAWLVLYERDYLRSRRARRGTAGS
jgi:hypothetical protein